MKESKSRVKGELVEKLKQAIIDADFDQAPQITQEALQAGVAPRVLMEKSISAGIMELEEKLFHGYKVWGHPILYMAVEAARRSLLVLEPSFQMPEEEALGTVVLGTPQGDVHDMGGKMVALSLTAAGFRVIYLGRDVPSSVFVHKVKESGAQVLGISSYQANSFEKILEIQDMLTMAGLKDKVKIMAGGCAITQKFTDKVGISYGKTASDAVRLCLQFTGGN